MYQKLPDDPFITEMDPIQKVYMFYHWLEDEKENADKLKNQAYTIGGFSNPEMLQKILQQQNQGNVISSSDEDYEKSLKMVRGELEVETKKSRKRRRKKIGT